MSPKILNQRRHGWLIPVSLLLTFPCHSETVDLEYLKQVDPDLYQQLLRIEQCRQDHQSIEQCRENTVAKVTASSQIAVKPSQPAAAPATPANWWLSSAYKNTTPMSHWIHAGSANVSLNSMNGNISGSQHSGQIDYYARYGTWTNDFSYIYSKDNVSQAGYLVSDRDLRVFQYVGSYDFNRTWFAQTGYINNQDSVSAINDKTTYYIGGGSYFGSSTDYEFDTLLAIGHQNENFDADDASATGLNRFSYNVVYASEHFSWSLMKNLKLSQSFSILQSINEQPIFELIEQTQCLETLSTTATYCVEGYEKSRHLKLSLGLEYLLNRDIALTYQLNFDHNSQPFLDDNAVNSSQNLGIKFSFQ